MYSAASNSLIDPSIFFRSIVISPSGRSLQRISTFSNSTKAAKVKIEYVWSTYALAIRLLAPILAQDRRGFPKALVSILRELHHEDLPSVLARVKPMVLHTPQLDLVDIFPSDL